MNQNCTHFRASSRRRKKVFKTKTSILFLIVLIFLICLNGVDCAKHSRRGRKGGKRCSDYQVSPWTPCKKPCDMGISTRVVTSGKNCKLKKEQRLCKIRSCDEALFKPQKKVKFCSCFKFVYVEKITILFVLFDSVRCPALQRSVEQPEKNWRLGIEILLLLLLLMLSYCFIPSPLFLGMEARHKTVIKSHTTNLIKIRPQQCRPVASPSTRRIIAGAPKRLLKSCC